MARSTKSICPTCKKENRIVCECGPAYTIGSATLHKFRRKAAAAGSLMSLPRSERVAYANAVEAAIRSANNAWWRVGLSLTEPKPVNVGAETRARNAAAFAAACAKDRNKSPATWASEYAEAMAEKKARAAASDPTCVTEKDFNDRVAGKPPTAIAKYWAESASASVANKAAAAATAKVSASALAAKRSEAARKANETRKARKLGKAA